MTFQYMYAIVDIETTGGSSRIEKITEIAIFQHDGEKITGEFVTLINPERNIPYFITNLTGITNEMVENAPRFFEIAKTIVEMTEGRIIVAHNARFDYSFIRQEFKSLGYNFRRNLLDTVTTWQETDSRSQVIQSREHLQGSRDNDQRQAQGCR